MQYSSVFSRLFSRKAVILLMHKHEMQETHVNLRISCRNNKKALHFCKTSGADTRIRTGDLILTKDALYLLSYISTLLHRATDIYYHIFSENARGNFHFFEKISESYPASKNTCQHADVCFGTNYGGRSFEVFVSMGDVQQERPPSSFSASNRQRCSPARPARRCTG